MSRVCPLKCRGARRETRGGQKNLFWNCSCRCRGCYETVPSLRCLCRSCAAAPRLNYLSHFTAGSRPRLTQMPPLRGWFETKCDGLFHRSARIAVTTQTPPGLGEFFPLYPALRLPHPNSRPSASLRAGYRGANRGPRFRLRAELDCFAPTALSSSRLVPPMQPERSFVTVSDAPGLERREFWFATETLQQRVTYKAGVAKNPRPILCPIMCNAEGALLHRRLAYSTLACL